MCDRYYRRADKQYIAEHFHLYGDLTGIILPDWDYNVAPNTHQPVIRNSRDTGERELVLMRWGLVPNFANSPADFKGFSTINARAENILKSAVWHFPLHHRRCLVPADGFYDWKAMRGVDNGVAATTNSAISPYAFSMADGATFAFAGLWDYWKDDVGNWLRSFAIITTEANELIEPIHNRMPVILEPADYSRWLTRDPGDIIGKGDTELPIDLLLRYKADAMKSLCCNPLVGNVRNNGPEMLNST